MLHVGSIHFFFKGDQRARFHFLVERDVGRCEAGEHPGLDLVLARKLDRTGLQDLAAQAGHLEHLLEGDAIKPAGFGDDARVGGVDAVDIGVDQAFIRMDGSCHGHGRGVGTAAAQRGDVAFAVDALEAGDDDHPSLLEVLADATVVDGFDAGLGVGIIGDDGNLPAGEADGIDALALEGHGQQGHGSLFASGGEHVELAPVGLGLDGLGQVDEAIGLARHGRRNDHHLVAGTMPFGNPPGHVLDAFDRPHRGTAVFVNDERH